MKGNTALAPGNPGVYVSGIAYLVSCSGVVKLGALELGLPVSWLTIILPGGLVGSQEPGSPS